MLLFELIAGKKAVIDQAVAGFVLHPDAVLAQSVAEALAASATQTLIERLVRMRPWLPQTRQAILDATIRAMRLNALSPVKTELAKVIKCYVSVCDGSGTRSLFVTQRVGAHYQLASVMMKLAGVADAVVLPELSKAALLGCCNWRSPTISPLDICRRSNWSRWWRVSALAQFIPIMLESVPAWSPQ